jgi:sugar phosphate isomerase/epimerase
MLHSGLVSVTFRKLSVTEIVTLVTEAGLEGIEWGGDVHVPHGDLTRARETRRCTLDAGIKIASYGSYYRLGNDEISFELVLETALELGAPGIRVWAGTRGSAKEDEDYWQEIIDASRQVIEVAARSGISISYEFHPDTLADTTESTLRLLNAVAHPDLFTYWQVPTNADVQKNRDSLKRLLDRISNIHVFHLNPGYERCPLEDGQEDWIKYLDILCSSEREHYAMLEFVRSDSVDAFREDARTLIRWLDARK